MQRAIKYTIFRTKWGFFGLVGTENAICRVYLPADNRQKIESKLVKYAPIAKWESQLFSTIQQQIISYFEGSCVNFSTDIPILLDGLSRFSQLVLTACRNIRFGDTISYSGLAKKIGRPDAARAVGATLAKNPLPLIIPCHRVIRSDGKVGGFSAAGGKNLKERLLRLERQILRKKKNRSA
jgi:methylated-DNA-[protein]-cysteine S-methyltransferase